MHLPKGFALDAVVGFEPGGHFGNIGREYSSILAPLMDLGFGSLDDAASVSRYRIDFLFVVVLSYEKFSHRRAGYSVKLTYPMIGYRKFFLFLVTHWRPPVISLHYYDCLIPIFIIKSASHHVCYL